MASYLYGSLNPNWRGGSSDRGSCLLCGASTWKKEVIRCKACYSKQLAQRIGPLNPEWNNFSSTKIFQGRERALRRKKLGTCERCQQKPAIDRHHIDRNPFNNAPENLKGLCRSCHMLEEGRGGRRSKRKNPLVPGI
jgi:5-methylcytosine-specific restriction endonuclease McrA